MSVGTKEIWKSDMRIVWVLISVWAVALVISWGNPKDQLTWWLEAVPVIVAAPVLVFTYTRFALPRYVYAWIFLHGLVLIIGAHYTYAEVPFGFWLQDLCGFSRNHFDRIGHFLQGFVPALVVREILRRVVKVDSRYWRYFLTTCVCMAISVSYELIEWWSALILGQGADAFLGTQGDVWDTQWDVFLATVGACLAQLLYPNGSNSKKA